MILARTLFTASLLIGAGTAPAHAQSRSDAPIAVRVDAGKPGAKIDRNIFGQFAEHLGAGIYGGVWVGKESKIPNVRGIRSDVVAALKAIRVPNIRWPGGCFADEYHWQDGIGPASKRPSSINTNWGGAVEPNSFGTDEFMDFIGQVGADAYVSVNVGSGTVREAADWMAYMTADPTSSAGKARAANGHSAPYKVKYLGLGNEAWGCGGSMTPEHYVDTMKPFARFTHNLNATQTGDDMMQRIAVGPNGGDTAYTEAVMKAYHDHDWAWAIEGLSLHNYTLGAGFPPTFASTGFDDKAYATIVKETLGMDDLIARHSAIMDKYDPEKKVALAVDEWGVWLAPTPGSNPGFLQQQNSMRDAIVAALNINIFARHADRVRITNIAQMINVLQAMILTDGDKMVLTPTYHVYQMYVPFHDATFVPATFEAGTVKIGDVTLPHIDAIAARSADGKLWAALTNLDPDHPVAVKMSFTGVTPKSAVGTMLTAPAIDSVNSFDKPDAVTPKPFSAQATGGALTLSVPARSVMVVQIAE